MLRFATEKDLRFSIKVRNVSESAIQEVVRCQSVTHHKSNSCSID